MRPTEEDEMSASQPMSRPDAATRLLANVSLPDTPLISRAIEFDRSPVNQVL